MTNLETIVLAKIILDRQARYELLALGAHMRGLMVVPPELLTGINQETLRTYRPGGSWPNKACTAVAWRANLYSKLAEEELSDAVHFLQLRSDADSVLHALFALEEACSKLERRHLALMQRGNARLAERSDGARAAEPRAEADGAASVASTPPRVETFSESEEPTRPTPLPGHRSGTSQGAPRAAAPKFGRVLTPPPKPSKGGK